MKWALPLFFFLLSMYLLVFPEELRPEQELRPVWSIDIDRAVLSPAVENHRDGEPLLPFTLGDRFGYVSSGGDLLFRADKIYSVAIDEERFINYSSVSGNLVIQDSQGAVTDTMELRGYPIIRDGRLFLISTNRSELAEISNSGEYLWKREYAAVITAIDTKSGVLALGLLDSRVELLDSSGDVTFQLDAIGSRINAVYGCTLSDGAERLAVVHGIDPQYVTIVNLTEDGAVLLKKEMLNEFRTTRLIRFFETEKYILVEDESSLVILDIEQNETFVVSTAGALLDVGSMSGDNLIWAVSRGAESSELLIIHLPDKVLFRVPYAGGAELVVSRGDRLYLGVDRYIGMIELVER